MAENKFIERRKENRLPFGAKVIFTDGQKAVAAYAANISRGGLFVTTLDPYPLETSGFLAFVLPNQEQTICVRAKVAHIAFDRQRCEVECGMGIQFVDLTESQRSVMNLHILNEQGTYLEMKRMLEEPRPDLVALEACLKRMPTLAGYDLLGLRYKVNRICTIFEPALDPFAPETEEKTVIAEIA